MAQIFSFNFINYFTLKRLICGVPIFFICLVGQPEFAKATILLTLCIYAGLVGDMCKIVTAVVSMYWMPIFQKN